MIPKAFLPLLRIFTTFLIMVMSVCYPDLFCQNYTKANLSSLPAEGGQAFHQVEKPDEFIWKTTINDNIFYLVGSVHLGKQKYFPMPAKYHECYKASDVMIMELQETFDEIYDKILQYAEKDRLYADEYFRHNLDSVTIEKIIRILGRDQFLIYDQYEGWLLNMIISGMRGKLAGYDPEYGVDKYFRELADSEGKKVIGMDSLSLQISLFEFDLPYESQVQILKNAVENMEGSVNLETPLMDYYYQGDTGGFSQYFVSMYDFENQNIKYAYELVFTQRNIKWADRIEEISRQGKQTCMVLVGAGHFFGPGNLLDILRERGYIIEHVE